MGRELDVKDAWASAEQGEGLDPRIAGGPGAMAPPAGGPPAAGNTTAVV